ncbi:hypothetical protein IWQ62_000557 [Dispira parvispora]|uniref:Cytochrome c oxidase assembly factor 5 n=1 Tax=Dispira parvispora TaxID=1520584 RepID=A0A9W8B117_9FUNG|nr:hypothetical protein IWQ62_000557 [Dispira parvispora]
MPGTCHPVRDDLIKCILKSDCVTKDKHSVKDCLKEPHLRESLPPECQSLRLSYLECKRSLGNTVPSIAGWTH